LVLDRLSEVNQGLGIIEWPGSSPLRLPRFHYAPVEGAFKVKRGEKGTRSEEEREKGKGERRQWAAYDQRPRGPTQKREKRGRQWFVDVGSGKHTLARTNLLAITTAFVCGSAAQSAPEKSCLICDDIG
jgi:hypothetical protein